MRVISTALWRFMGLCSNNHEFVTHEFPDFQYGDRLIRTSDPRELALVEAMENPNFDEIGNMVTELVAESGREKQMLSCFDRVFGSICDLAPSGRQYDFTEKVRCPICGTAEILRYGPGKSPQTDMVELTCITYNAWQRLNQEEKRDRLRSALRKIGCID